MRHVIFVLLATTTVAACSSSSPAISSADAGVEPDGGASVADGSAAIVDGGDAGIDAGPTCTAAKEQLLKPIDTVSTGEVTVLADSGGLRTVYVDASAGGTAAQGTNPRIYINLETATRAPVTDRSAASSTAWDLAIKRPVLFANSGDGGPGTGGGIFFPGKSLGELTAADAAGKTFPRETFFDAECNALLDPTGAVKTSFDGWYDYDGATNQVTPKAGAWIIRGGTGKLYKVRIDGYYATGDGGVGMSGGRYLLTVGAL
ncbi:MAG: hypothetical protein HOO96_12075 [Polyangiaceae bacterium]|nr:hypothetical protein [Polyangiaceae bacterium]